jgi:hypothetical protein
MWNLDFRWISVVRRKDGKEGRALSFIPQRALLESIVRKEHMSKSIIRERVD